MLGDFNAVVGSLQAGLEAVVGPHGSSVRTDNGSKLLDFARGYSLTVAGITLATPKKLQSLPQCSV